MAELEEFFDKSGKNIKENVDVFGNYIQVNVDNFESMQRLDKLIEYLHQTNNHKFDTIVLQTSKDYLDKKQDLDVMRAYAEYINDKHNEYKLKVSLGYKRRHGDDNRDMDSDYENLSIAHKVVDEFVNKVKNMTIEVDGKPQPLSPLEKFMVVYEFCAHRFYKEDEQDASKSRTWINVLGGDKIVCVGYASLLKCLCDRIFDKKELACIKQSSSVLDKQNKLIGDHANNLIFINDDKYNVHGLFHSDACWGSIKEDNPNVDYTYALVPILQMQHHNRHNYNWVDSKSLYNKLSLEKGANGYYYEHFTYSFLMNYFGQESYAEMKLRYKNEQEEKNNKIKEHNKKIDELNDKLEAEMLTKIKPIYAEFEKNNNLQELMSLPYIGKHIGELSKTPCVAKIYRYIENISPETICDITKQDLLDYKQFVQDNKDFFDSQMAKINDSIAFFGDFNYDFSLRNKVLNEIINSVPHYTKEKISYDFIEPFDEYRDKFDSVIKENENFIYAKPLSKKQLANALVPVANALGVNAKKYVTEVVTHTQKRTEQNFNSEYFNQYNYDIVGKSKKTEKEIAK